MICTKPHAALQQRAHHSSLQRCLVTLSRLAVSHHPLQTLHALPTSASRRLTRLTFTPSTTSASPSSTQTAKQPQRTPRARRQGIATGWTATARNSTTRHNTAPLVSAALQPASPDSQFAAVHPAQSSPPRTPQPPNERDRKPDPAVGSCLSLLLTEPYGWPPGPMAAVISPPNPIQFRQSHSGRAGMS